VPYLSQNTVVRNTFFNAAVISPTQWPRVLKRGSAAADLLGLRVRILPKNRVSFVCVCQVEVNRAGLSREVLPSVVCSNVISELQL